MENSAAPFSILLVSLLLDIKYRLSYSFFFVTVETRYPASASAFRQERGNRVKIFSRRVVRLPKSTAALHREEEKGSRRRRVNCNGTMSRSEPPNLHSQFKQLLFSAYFFFQWNAANCSNDHLSQSL